MHFGDNVVTVAWYGPTQKGFGLEGTPDAHTCYCFSDLSSHKGNVWKLVGLDNPKRLMTADEWRADGDSKANLTIGIGLGLVLGVVSQIVIALLK